MVLPLVYALGRSSLDSCSMSQACVLHLLTSFIQLVLKVCHCNFPNSIPYVSNFFSSFITSGFFSFPISPVSSSITPGIQTVYLEITVFLPLVQIHCFSPPSFSKSCPVAWLRRLTWHQPLTFFIGPCTTSYVNTFYPIYEPALKIICSASNLETVFVFQQSLGEMFHLQNPVALPSALCSTPGSTPENNTSFSVVHLSSHIHLSKYSSQLIFSLTP